MPNVKQASMWCSHVWRDAKPYIIQNNWRVSKILPVDWSVDFAMDGECEKLRMKEATNKLASFISSWSLGSGGLPIEEYVQSLLENYAPKKLHWNRLRLHWPTWCAVAKRLQNPFYHFCHICGSKFLIVSLFQRHNCKLFEFTCIGTNVWTTTWK